MASGLVSFVHYLFSYGSTASAIVSMRTCRRRGASQKSFSSSPPRPKKKTKSGFPSRARFENPWPEPPCNPGPFFPKTPPIGKHTGLEQIQCCNLLTRNKKKEERHLD